MGVGEVMRSSITTISATQNVAPHWIGVDWSRRITVRDSPGPSVKVAWQTRLSCAGPAPLKADLRTCQELFTSTRSGNESSGAFMLSWNSALCSDSQR